MEIKTGISLQTKQQLSQLQVESLNILAMSMTELKDFLQNEEIENPLVEYKFEAYEMFQEMMQAIQETVVMYLYHIQIHFALPPEEDDPLAQATLHDGDESAPAEPAGKN